MAVPLKTLKSPHNKTQIQEVLLQLPPMERLLVN